MDREPPFEERALALLLGLDGVFLLTALIPSMMPFAWMQAIHQAMGMGELVKGPLMSYLTRSLSVMYALHGAVMLFISFDVRRYLPVVKFIAVLAILFGLWMTGLDIVVGMPIVWIISEGPFVVLLGCTMLWLTGRVRN